MSSTLRRTKLRIGARIYLRISRPDEIVILRNQEVRARHHVKDQGYKLNGIYADIASGGSDNRKGFNDLLHDVQAGEVVVFTSLSRMTRGGIGAALDVLRRLKDMGVGWNFIDQSILNFDSKTDKLVKDILLSVFAAVDEDYRRRISEATKAAYKRKLRGTDKPRWGRPKGSKSARCAECGEVGQANVHRGKYHRFRSGQDGSCAECGKSPAANGHVPFWHPFKRGPPAKRVKKRTQ